MIAVSRRSTVFHDAPVKLRRGARIVPTAYSGGSNHPSDRTPPRRKSDQKGKNVKKTPTVLCALSGMLTVIVPVVAFSAAPAMAISPIALCSSPGTALSGSYKSLTITGNEYVANNGVLTVSGNVTLAPGACLDAFSMGTVNVGGNVFVGKGSTLALGC